MRLSLSVASAVLLAATAWSQSETAAVDDEIIVNAPPANTGIAVEIQRMHNAYHDGEQGSRLYRVKRYAEAFPYLLRNAKRGFKGAQARIAYYYLSGMDPVAEDLERAVGWFGVAAHGSSAPWIRAWYHDVLRQIPDQSQPRAREVVAWYVAHYAARDLGVWCDMAAHAGTHIKRLRCRYEREIDYNRLFGGSLMDAAAAAGSSP
ncbi:MAG: hypothetical protein OXG82_11895 [Gammaproteobacteria bacterium]|nr:hypothetical protein [Gammaproteobacteria bacterium]